MEILHKIKTILFLTAFVLVFSSALFYMKKTVEATPIGAPYGGFVTDVFFCSCSGSEILTLSPGFVSLVPVVLPVMYVPGTEAYAWWNMGTPGIWALGALAPTWQCWVPTVDPPCTVIFEGPLVEPLTGSSPF